MLKRISSTTKTVEQLPTQQEETGEEEEEHQVQYSTVQYSTGGAGRAPGRGHGVAFGKLFQIALRRPLMKATN